MKPFRLVVRVLTPVVCAGTAAACATTSTQKIQLAPEEIRAEEAKQRELVLLSHDAHRQRLLNVAYPILRSAAPLCNGDVIRGAGVATDNLHNYDKDWREAARAALRLGDTLRVVAVAESSPARAAGMQVGDALLAIHGHPIPPGRNAGRALADGVRALSEAGATEAEYLIERDGTELRIASALDELCGYPVQVLPTSDLNAYADGRRIYVTASMMRFADDHELAAIVAHELAHNAMGRIGAKKRNALLGALAGALLDVASTAATGYSTGGAYTAQGAQLGVAAYSQDFETEADYVGLYAMALAGLELEAASTFWRHLAQANPQSIGFASSHPTTVERFLRMEKAIEEIRRKQELGQPIRPNPKGGDESR